MQNFEATQSKGQPTTFEIPKFEQSNLNCGIQRYVLKDIKVDVINTDGLESSLVETEISLHADGSLLNSLEV